MGTASCSTLVTTTSRSNARRDVAGSGMTAPETPAAPPADLAVVVVNYNAGEYLARCVRSVVDASGGLALDLLVIDNASHDGSARAAAARAPEVRLVENPTNRGLSAAWNQGARAVGAPWILFLNPDAELCHGDLGAFVAAGEARSDVAVLGPVIRNPDGSIYESGRVFPGVVLAVGHAFLGPFAPGNRFTRAYRQASWDRTTEREVDWVSFAAMLIRRSALDQVGGFDEGFWLYGEELDLCTRLRDAGWKVLASPVLEVLHEGGVSTGRSRRTHLMHSQGVFRYYRKHRAKGWRRATLPLAWATLRARAELVARRERSTDAD
jgi:N-acetylglucosaminyl-diphospho-decaprenol L-rhamnosyltransferase